MTRAPRRMITSRPRRTVAGSEGLFRYCLRTSLTLLGMVALLAGCGATSGSAPRPTSAHATTSTTCPRPHTSPTSSSGRIVIKECGTNGGGTFRQS